MDDASFVKLKGEALFVIGLRGGYATLRRNARKRMKVDDDEARNNKPTLLLSLFDGCKTSEVREDKEG